MQINGAVQCVHELENSVIKKYNVLKSINLYIQYNPNQSTIIFSAYK